MEVLKEQNRARVASACLQCKLRKKRCDGNIPSCSSCANRGVACDNLQVREVRRRGRGKAKAYVESLEKRIGTMETALYASVPIQNKTATSTSSTCRSRDLLSPKHIEEISEGFDTLLSASEELRRLHDGPMAQQTHEAEPARSNLRTQGPPTEALDAHSETSSALRDKLMEIIPNFCIGELPTPQIKCGSITSTMFMGLTQDAHLHSLFETTFDDMNCSWPLFNLSTLVALLEEQYASDVASTSKNVARWGMLNAAVAMAIQLRSAKGSYSEMIDTSWHFFKSAFSVFPTIASRGTDVLALEALLAMALFMQRTSDSRTTSLLVSASARLSLTLGLHKKSFYTDLDPVAAERHKRAFWVAYILDQDISIKTGLSPIYNNDDISLEYADLDSLGCPGKIIVSGKSIEAILFRLRAELAVIESSIQNQLYSEKSAKQSADQILEVIVELDYRLRHWKEKIPLGARPDHIDWSAVTSPREPIILLSFAYYRAMSAVHSCAVHLNPKIHGTLLSYSVSSGAIHIDTAYKTIRLLRDLPPQLPGCLWQILSNPLSACIALLALLLETPTDTRARLHLQHINDFVGFLTKVLHHKDLDVKRMMNFCSELEKVSAETLTTVTNILQSPQLSVSGSSRRTLNAKAQRLASQLATSPNYIQLAHGLMGNLPSLQLVAASVFSDFLGSDWIPNSSSGPLAPALVVPETYKFASTQWSN